MRAIVRIGAAALLAVPLSACGGGSQPADEVVPQLAEQLLQQIDQALASEQYHRARKELHALASVVVSASDSGDQNGQADGILAAAADLRAALPTPTPSPEPTVDTQTEPPTGEGDEESEDEAGKPEKPEKPVKEHPEPDPKEPKDPKGEAKGHDK